MRRTSLVLLLAACAREPDARMTAGREVFTSLASPTCSTCHTLRHADATGAVGPDLDVMRPDSQRVAAAVISGVGAMPAQGDNLTPAQIAAVAGYVARAAAMPD